MPDPPGIGAPVSWSRLPGWEHDRHAEAWPALLASCDSRAGTAGEWAPLCQAARTLDAPDDAAARRFFETWFVPHRVTDSDGDRSGLITGYYEPVLHGSPVRTERYRYPLYQRPKDLLTIDLGELYPELRGKRLRGRVEGNKVVPYYSRGDIVHTQEVLAGEELLWVDDPIALFFLQVQGSGRVLLPDGRELAVGYADQNGHPYVAVGRCLIETGALKTEEVTLQSIRAWLRANPEQAPRMLNCNPSFVFFGLRDIPSEQGPVGSLNVPLTAQRSIAVDPAHIPLGVPVWLETTRPDNDERLERLVFAQDTGGAIRGAVRADVFFGRGDEAELLAGAMKQPGRLYVLLPRADRYIAAR